MVRLALGVFKVNTDPFGLTEAEDGDEFFEGLSVIHIAHRLVLSECGCVECRHRC